MSSNFRSLKNDEEIYAEMLLQSNGLLDVNERPLTNLANITALIKEALPKVSWVGFYLFDGVELYLGPFQGKVACTRIALGKGVCGVSAERKETIVVEDVHKFPEHITCDSGSNSEIVVPIINEGELLGVLDLDSYEFAAFNKNDALYLEKITQKIVDCCFKSKLV